MIATEYRLIFLFMTQLLFKFVSISLVAGLVALPLHAGELKRRVEIAGPVVADVLRVIDGDTILVSARPWPQQTMEVYVRLRGIDAPELKSKCDPTRLAARAAYVALANLTDGQRDIRLVHIASDKYFGRIVADIELADGRNPAQEMLAAGLVSPYEGGHKTDAACAPPE